VTRRRRRAVGILAGAGLGFALSGALLASPPGAGGPILLGGDPLTAGLAAEVAGGSTPAPTIGPHGDEVAGDGGPASSGTTSAPNERRACRDRKLAGPRLLSGYAWPIDHARITNAFGRGRPGSFVQGGQTLHDGIDISSFCGDRIVAAHDGVVLAAGRRHAAFVGWLGDLTAFRAKLDADHAWWTQAIAVVIDDGNGYRSIYLHLGLATVEPGDRVEAGDLIGYEGSTGNSTGCHLHYALFSPWATASFRLDPRIAERNRLPAYEVARIDPLFVLPPLDAASITWGWGARDGS
jgi:murein DD-endopeptidase MepM/ murein hydrolase activator NlpD